MLFTALTPSAMLLELPFLHDASNCLTAEITGDVIEDASARILKLVVLRGVHLLEREKNGSKRCTILKCAFPYQARAWTALLVRHAKDLEHLKRPAAALAAYESILGIGGGVSLNIAPSYRIGCERMQKAEQTSKTLKVPKFRLRCAEITPMEPAAHGLG